MVEQRGRKPSITEIGYTRLIIDAVIENLGVSLLPRFTLEEALREKSRIIFRKRISVVYVDAGNLQQKPMGVTGDEGIY